MVLIMSKILLSELKPENSREAAMLDAIDNAYAKTMALKIKLNTPPPVTPEMLEEVIEMIVGIAAMDPPAGVSERVARVYMALCTLSADAQGYEQVIGAAQDLANGVLDALE